VAGFLLAFPAHIAAVAFLQKMRCPCLCSLALWCLSSIFSTARAYTAHQRWVYVNNQLRYKVNSAYCASISQGEIADGSDILLWHCGTSNEFLWEVDGPFIRSKANPKFCLSVREGKAGDGSDVILWTCDSTSEYKWKIEGEHVKYESDHRYWLSVRQDEIVDGQKLILWSGPSTGFRWIVESGSPHIKLKAKPSLCASTKSGKMDNGQGAILHACGPSDSRGQGWELVDDQLRSKTDASKCLTVREGKWKDGQDIIVWNCDKGTAYHWIVSGEHIRLKDVPDYCLAVDDNSRSGAGSRLELMHCDSPDAEDTEGLEFHNKHTGDHQTNTFRWKIGADGGIRSFLDPRYCASVTGGLITDGSNIIMWHCGMSEKHSNLGTEFQWQVEGQFIKLKKNPRFCMSVREGKHGDGSDFILWTCGNSNAYRFDIQGNSIRYHADPQYQMAVRQGVIRDGSDVILWTGIGNAFLWKFDHEKIKLKVDDKYCMSVREGKVGDGSDIILWTCGTEEAMQWVVSGDHISQYTNPDKCLAVRKNEYKDGSDIILWSCDDMDPAQKWVVTGDRIRYKGHQDYCVSIRDGKATDGSDVILWSCDEKLTTDDGEL